MKGMSLHWKIIIGMIFGIIFGLLANNFGLVLFTQNWIKPFGVIFVNLLKLIAVPLVFASLVKGISSLSNTSKISVIGFKTIIFYIFSTVIAVTIGLILVNVIQPGDAFSEIAKNDLKKSYSTEIVEKINSAEDLKGGSPLQFLVDIVPSNIIYSATENKNMLQIIFFAIIFSISMIMLPKENVKYVKGFFDGINDIILMIVDLIMKVSPYGVFALLSGLVVDFGGSSNIFIALGMYSLTVVFGLLIMVLVFYPLILYLFTDIKYLQFFKGISPAQMLAFSTSSSAATLPVTMERCEQKLGVSKQVSSFVLPLGATINMDGTSLYQAVAAVFIAQAFGYDLNFSDQLTIILTATLASIGSAAVPGAGMVMLVIVLSSIGINPQGIALIFAVDRILDMLRTVVNVSGDATIAKLVDAYND